jgi:thiol-disulfide isomerase/thioredoxin
MNSAFKILQLLLITLFVSCDEIEGPFGEKSNNSGGGDTNVVYYRKVFVEDFTGHTCGNCPRAAEKIDLLKESYGDKVVSMAIHVGFFAEPSPAGTEFEADFRTPSGNELDQYFGNAAAGLPNGLINRKSFGGQTIIQYNDWSSKVAELLALPPDAWISTTPSVNQATREVSVSAQTKILQEISEPLSIAMYLVEDSIQSPQKDYSPTIPGGVIEDYYHRHMLRVAINGAFGSPLSSDLAYFVNQQFTTTANYTVPNTWNLSKLSIITVLYKTSSKEVVQVDEKHL